MTVAATVTAFLLGALVFLEAHTLSQTVHQPAATWPKASVRTAGSEGRLLYYAEKHR